MDIGQFIVHAMLMYILNLLSLDVFSTVKIVENALAGPLGSLQRSPGPLAGLRGKMGREKGGEKGENGIGKCTGKKGRKRKRGGGERRGRGRTRPSSFRC